MCDRTAPPGQATRPGSGLDLDLLDEAMRALARDALELLGHLHILHVQVGAISRSTLNAASALERARRHRDG